MHVFIPYLKLNSYIGMAEGGGTSRYLLPIAVEYN